MRRIAILLAALLLTACSTVASADSATPTAVQDSLLPANLNPLTGLPVADPAVLDRRPLVVKISNAPPLVRPQSGIGQADNVYEHYTEGGLTRFSAIFLGQAPERVGSIRSARLIDYELVPMYQGLLAFSGASIGVEEYLMRSEFFVRTYKGVLYGAPYYWRDESIEVPHNLFMNAAALWRLATEEGVNARPTLRGNTFGDGVPPGAAGAATHLDVRYRATLARWDYDPASGRYRRSSDGQPHYDANTGEQITAANVVVLYARHRVSSIVESQWQDSVTYGYEIELWFEGDALILRDGMQYSARWQRPTRESMLTLHTGDGTPFPLKPGNTWFQVFPLPTELNAAEESVTVGG